MEEYKEKLDKNKWEIVCQIASTLYDYEDEDILFKNIVQGIKKTAFPDSDEDSTDEDDTLLEVTIMDSLNCIIKV